MRASSRGIFAASWTIVGGEVDEIVNSEAVIKCVER